MKRISRKLKIAIVAALTVIMTCTLVVDSFAATTDWKGFTSGGATTQAWGRNNEYCFFHINFSKNNSTVYKRAKITFHCTNNTNKTEGAALRTEYLGNARTFTITSDNNSAVSVVTSPRTTAKTSYDGGTSSNPGGNYVYLYVPLSITIPKGYKVTSITHSYDTSLFSDSSACWLWENAARNSSNVQWTNDKGPYAKDTAVTKYLNINLGAAGVWRRYIDKGTNKGKYAYSMDSLNILLTANKTTVNFNGNGSTSGSMSAQTVTYDTSASLTNNAFKKSGYTFTGWNTKANGSGTTYANKAAVTTAFPTESSVTLYAQWRPNNYKLTFNPLGGTAQTTQVTVTQDATTNNTVGIAERSEYRFLGWYTAPIGGAQIYDEEGVASNHGNSGYWSASGTSAKWVKPFDNGKEIQLYAHWEPDLDGGYVQYFNQKIPQPASADFKIRKTDDYTMQPIAGVTFNLSGPNSYSQNRATDGDGIVTWKNLADGTYTLTEVAPPSGYKKLTTAQDGIHPYKVVVQGGKVNMFAVH